MIDETKNSLVTDDIVDLVGTGNTEERQLAQMVAVLTAEFPDVPYEVIVGLTRQAAERYETAKVRTFLPILVPKDVRAWLCDGAHGAGCRRKGPHRSAEGRCCS